MGYQRQAREEGEQIALGGISYRIDSIEGLGGSAIVYRASYEDGLNQAGRHQVIIKELFPLDSKGGIYRDSQGAVCCTPRGAELMKECRLRFLQGNQVNLKLLQEMPSKVSGNINSWAAYGTYYSVLSVHGGENLEFLLEKEDAPQNLKEAALILEKILNALEGFHKNGFLHLDISPDNILILSSQALLIDYNSVWNIENTDGREFCYSRKEGYSSPEVCLRNFRDIHFASDMYSVCAVFFRMLAGRPLSEDERMGAGLRKCFARGFPILEGETASAVHKTFQILARGLHTLPRKRYQSVEELRGEIRELTERIDREGVSHAALWEDSCAGIKQRKRLSGETLSRQILMEDGGQISEHELLDRLREGSQILLKGAGGMGKTTLMEGIWKAGTARYQPGSPVVSYVSLRGYREQGEEASYIRHTLLKNLGYGRPQKKNPDVRHQLETFLNTGAEEGVKLILLLDGLNEPGGRREKLLREIEELGDKPGVAVLLTDRTAEVREYALKSFMTAELLPLEDGTVEQELEKSGCPIPQEQGIRQLLANPMMLYLYREALGKPERRADEEASHIQSADDLVEIYLQRLCSKQLRTNSGSQALQLCSRYLLNHLLPSVAAEMARKKKTLLSFEELYETAARSYRNLRRKEFGKSFQEFLGKSRLILEGIADESEWFDFAVSEQLVGNLGLLVTDGGGYYGLVHDNFQKCLAKRDGKNRNLYRKKQKRRWAVKTLLVLLAALLLAGGGVCLWNLRHSGSYTQEEQKVVDRAAACMQNNLGVLSVQITIQREVLEEAGAEGVLENNPEDIENLKWWIDQKEGEADALAALQLKAELVEQLIAVDTGFPIEQIQSLCKKPVEMKSVMNQALARLEEMLCDPYSPYGGETERGELVQAYGQYLDAYVKEVFYEFDYVIMCLAPEKAGEILDDNRYTEIFRDYFDTVGITRQDPASVKAAMESAGEALKDSQDVMRTYHYQVDF